MNANPYRTPTALVADPNMSPGEVITNPHVLWRQVCGLLIWITVLSCFRGPVMVVLGVALGGVTFADAWVSGIYKRPDARSFLNISPMAWGILMVGLFVVAFPAYILSRKRLRTIRGGNGFFIATLIMGVVFLVYLVASFGLPADAGK